MREAPTMPNVQLDDLSLYYEVHGSGQRVLFCNGSGATIERTQPMFGSWSEHFELAIHDQRGLGRTGVPDRQATMADYAADALTLLDHLGWETVRLYASAFPRQLTPNPLTNRRFDLPGADSLGTHHGCAAMLMTTLPTFCSDAT
jgi:hypothetical protein